jgi:tripartite-type tricarboxylate transporter receptor subunit TctC
MIPPSRSITCLSLLLLVWAVGVAAAADPAGAKPLPVGYPAAPVRLIEPFGVGGGPDLLGRALARKLSALWRQPVTVENITGDGATAGPANVAISPADGYTLLINTNAQAYSAAFAARLPYDPLKDFVPVALLTSQPYVLVAGKSAGLTSVSDLVALAKSKPGALKFGSTGVGTATHIGALKFNLAAGIKVIHLPPAPSDSNADMITNLIAGRMTYCIVPISLVLPRLRDGSLVALGVTTTRRSTLLPEVPTIMEAGIASFDFPIWYGIWVRSGTPAAVIDQLARNFTSVLLEPDMRDWIVQHGGEPMKMTQPEFARFVVSESESAAAIIKSAGIEPQRSRDR